MRHFLRLAAASGALGLISLLGASSALGSDLYCVQKPPCSGGLQEPTLQAAISLADSDTDLDRIEIGPVTLPERDLVVFEPVDIVGSGPGTVIAGPPQTGSTTSPYVMWLRSDGNSSVSNLTIRLDQGANPLKANVLNLFKNTSDGVSVEGIGNVGTGVGLDQGGSFRNGTVTMPVGISDLGVSIHGSTVDNADITANSGIGGTGTVRAARIRGQTFGVTGTSLTPGGALTVEDTVIRTGPSISPSLTETGLGVTSSGSSASATMALTARHVTLLGSGAASALGLSSAAMAFGNAGASTSANARNLIIRGYGEALSRTASQTGGGTGTASLDIDWSDYDPSAGARIDSGTGSMVEGQNSLNVDPQFRDAPNADLRVRGTSPLIDRGDPAAPGAAESATDAGGRTRVVDGDADGSARRDIGAYEYQGRPSVASFGAAPNPAQAGQAVTFSASGAASAESAIAGYTWDLDGDGTFETDTGQTASATRAYATPGNVPVRVRVTAADGGSTVASLPLTVVAAPPPITTAPVIGSFGLTNKSFTVGAGSTAVSARKRPRGTVFSYALSEPAAVTVTIALKTPGRRVAGKCVPRSRRNTRRAKCIRFVNVGTLRRTGARGRNTLPFSGRIGKRPLKPGTYRATILAVDGGGRRSKTRAVSFVVVAR